MTDPFYRDALPAMEASVTRPGFPGWNELQSPVEDRVNRWLSDDERADGDLDAGLRRLWENMADRR